MKTVSVQKIAKILTALVNIALICNLLALFFVPGLVLIKGPQEPMAPYENPLELPARLLAVFALSWRWIWQAGAFAAVLAVFLLFSGCCTAVVLLQGRRVLKTILRGEPFSMENAVSLNRAALCAFLIAAAALIRLLFSLVWYGSIRPLLTYNALFVPIFAMAGLLCLVMSALFRQAAELKAENDLTI